MAPERKAEPIDVYRMPGYVAKAAVAARGELDEVAVGENPVVNYIGPTQEWGEMRETRGEEGGPTPVGGGRGDPGGQRRAPYADLGEQCARVRWRNNQTVIRRDAVWASFQKACNAVRQLVPRDNDELIGSGTKWVGQMREYDFHQRGKLQGRKRAEEATERLEERAREVKRELRVKDPDTEVHAKASVVERVHAEALGEVARQKLADAELKWKEDRARHESVDLLHRESLLRIAVL